MELRVWVCASLRHSGSLRRSDGAGVSLQAAFQNEHPARPASSLLWPPAMACKTPFFLALLPSRARSTPLLGASFPRYTSDHTIPEWILRWLPTGIRTKSEPLTIACRTLKLSLLLASPALYSSLYSILQPQGHSFSSSNTPSLSLSGCGGAGLFLWFRTLFALTSQSCSSPPSGLKGNACPPTLGKPFLITLK